MASQAIQGTLYIIERPNRELVPGDNVRILGVAKESPAQAGSDADTEDDILLDPCLRVAEQ